MFTVLDPERTGIKAENHYADPAMWGSKYRVFEIGPIGTGIAIGDFDRDGRPDVFVVSKTESCRLFRNLGDWKFEDVTESAGVGDRGAAAAIWKQGAAFADLNSDGWLDLYVCRFDAPNLLYINQRDGTFKEQGRAAGLAVRDASLMAAFCDYDRDGWLDLYLQTNLLDNAQSPAGRPDYLFRNNGDGTFRDVTAEAGLSRTPSQGNAAIWWDFDQDGWPDLYVANDFAEPDRLYLNRGDGTLVDVIATVVPHTPYSAMGADVGDVNNDGWLDLLVADMAASTHAKDQRGMADARNKAREPAPGDPAAPGYLRNALYVNTGAGRCLEAAFLAGVAATDWTWSVRFEDFDNDGRLDLHVTTGMHREVHNVDLLHRMMTTESAAERVRVVRATPVLAERNLAFRNRGDLAFEEVGAAWGLDQLGVSFGAATGDLDGDGDLDLVVANFEAGPTVLRNDAPAGNRLLVELRGTVSNRFGIGAMVTVETAAGRQVRPLLGARGYMSTSEPIVHFGLGADERVRSLVIEWPSGHRQTFQDLAVNHRYLVTEPSGVPPTLPPSPAMPLLFREVGKAANLAWPSPDNPVDEFAQQRLLPIRFNANGPALAVTDIDADGADDVVLGGTNRVPTRVLLAARDGTYKMSSGASFAVEAAIPDGPILSFDANGDDRPDLLVTKSGAGLPAGAPPYRPRLYLNDGNGGFAAAPAAALPPLPISAGAIAAADFNRDGRLDVFIGGRVAPGAYPTAPRSALLANEGGRLVDVTAQRAPGLQTVGMVTAVVWSDVDLDGWPDLLLALDWGQVKFFRNEGGRHFADHSDRAGFTAAGTGWWTSLASADFNGDGRPDFVAGNVGLNTQYHGSPGRPALLLLDDIRGSGGPPQLIEAHYAGDRLVPWRTRRVLGQTIPAIMRRFPANDAFAAASLEQILGDAVRTAPRWTATELRSGVFLSQPDGTYRFTPLPRVAQVAPAQGMAIADFNADGHADLAMAQNSHAPAAAVGRFDGGIGQILWGDGLGGFRPAGPAQTGFVVSGDANALVVLDLDGDGWPDLLTSRHQDTTLAYRHQGVPGRQSRRIILRGPPGNPTGIGARIHLTRADGTVQVHEVAGASASFSQASAAWFVGFPADQPPRALHVRWPDGRTTPFGGSLDTAVISIPWVQP